MRLKSIVLTAVSVICTTSPVFAQDQKVKSDSNLTVVVPLDVTDLTDDVFGIEIGCLAFSTLLGAGDSIVGAGRVAVLMPTVTHSGSKRSKRLSQMHRFTPRLSITTLMPCPSRFWRM